jgi:hypothetical protein
MAFFPEKSFFNSLLINKSKSRNQDAALSDIDKASSSNLIKANSAQSHKDSSGSSIMVIFSTGRNAFSFVAKGRNSRIVL